MGKSWRTATSIAVFCLALTACTGQSRNALDTPAKRIPPDPATQRLDDQERVDRQQAEDEARGLLERVRIPPGAVVLNFAPVELLGPALGIPLTSSTYIRLARYWRVPMSFKAADDYVRQHPPAGLAQVGSSFETRQGLTMHGYAWDGQALPFSRGGQLSIEVAGRVAAAAGGDLSYLRVVAGSPWLDPHPFRDSTDGPRLRLESGRSCPASGQGTVGVRNDGADELDGALVPDGAPDSGLVCVYPGGSDLISTLLRHRAVSRAEAVRVAAAARSVELAHPNGPVINCSGMPGSTFVVVLRYPGRPAVNLYLRTGECSTASNGHVVAPISPSLTALVDVVNQVAG
jgi:hypothetical protein